MPTNTKYKRRDEGISTAAGEEPSEPLGGAMNGLHFPVALVFVACFSPAPAPASAQMRFPKLGPLRPFDPSSFFSSRWRLHVSSRGDRHALGLRVANPRGRCASRCVTRPWATCSPQRCGLVCADTLYEYSYVTRTTLPERTLASSGAAECETDLLLQVPRCGWVVGSGPGCGCDEQIPATEVFK